MTDWRKRGEPGATSKINYERPGSPVLALACLGISLAISLSELHSNVTISVEIASAHVRSVIAA